jgi:hypothetical protein
MPGSVQEAVKDPDFLKAPVTQQMAYLSAIDPDFKAGKPEDQLAYLNHVTGKQAPTSAANTAETAPGAKQPKNYGFTGGNLLRNFGSGLGEMASGAYHFGKDLVDPHVNVVEGNDSLLHKYVTGPAEIEQQKARTAKTPYESFGHSVAEAIPLVGPWAASIGEQAATGDVGGATAKGLAQVGAAKALPYLPKVGEHVKNFVTNAPTSAQDIVGTLKNVQKPSIKQTEYDTRANAAIPDLRQVVADNKGQISSPRDMVDAIENHIGKLEQPMSDAARQMHTAGNKIDIEKPIVSAVDNAFEEKAGAYKDSEMAHARADLEDHIKGSKSLFELENLRRRLNDEASSYYKMNTAERNASGISDATMTAKRAAADALRDELYGDGKKAGAFENAGMTGDVRAIRQRVGNLLEIRNTLEKSITRAEQAGDWSGLKALLTRNPAGSIMSGGIGAIAGMMAGGPVGGILGGILGEGMNALKEYRETKNPNLNIQKAVGGLERMGAPTNLPTARFTPRPPTPAPYVSPRYAGTQQPLPFQRGSLFNMGQTPAPAAPAPPAPITGEQLPLNVPHGDLFGVGQTPAPRAAPPPAPIAGEQMSFPTAHGDLFQLQQTGQVPKTVGPLAKPRHSAIRMARERVRRTPFE